jgi:hypothetical protein
VNKEYFVKCDDPGTCILCDDKEAAILLIARLLGVSIELSTAKLAKAQPKTVGRTVEGVAPSTVTPCPHSNTAQVIVCLECGEELSIST